MSLLDRIFPGDDDPQGAADVARKDERVTSALREANERHSSACTCSACTWPLDPECWPADPIHQGWEI